MPRSLLCALACALLVASSALGQSPLTVEKLWGLDRLGDPRVSPDSEHVAFVATHYDFDGNSSWRGIYLTSLSGDGGARLLTAKGVNSSSPRFSPDGKWLYFRSARGGSTQVWRLPLGAGGEAEQLTDLPVGVGDFVASKTGEHLVFVADVWPDAADLAASAKRDAKEKAKKSKARVYTSLLFRHWNHWRDGRRSHVFSYRLGDGHVADLSPGPHDAPPVSLENLNGFAVSPDGREVAFTRNTTAVPATNTNNDIYTCAIDGGTPAKVTRTEGNDNAPRYSPDGKFLSYLAMARPGFEADRCVLTVRKRGSSDTMALTDQLDRSVREYVWAPDSSAVYFTATDRGCVAIYESVLGDASPKQIHRVGVSSSLRITADGETLVFMNQAFDRPPAVWALDLASGTARQVSHLNDARLKENAFGEASEFWFDGAKGTKVQGFLLKPPGFVEGKKYPAIVLIHGGPQGAFMDSFHWRWNAQLWCAPGYVGVIVNFHGSRGYGQKFCDAVTHDWGGAPYEDVMKGVDHAIEKFPFIDANRMAAAGGSYGGYMVNWICGKTDRFKCLISHAGIAENVSMFGATEEIWFPLWEFKNKPWESSELHDKWSPVRFAGNFKTPTLVIHGEHDYRVPYTQGLQMYTALQLQGVPSKLLFFPDEDHFIGKPQNAKVWWNTIHDWMNEYIGR